MVQLGKQQIFQAPNHFSDHQRHLKQQYLANEQHIHDTCGFDEEDDSGDKAADESEW